MCLVEVMLAGLMRMAFESLALKQRVRVAILKFLCVISWGSGPPVRKRETYETYVCLLVRLAYMLNLTAECRVFFILVLLGHSYLELGTE
jgi:hypothetical protein